MPRSRSPRGRKALRHEPAWKISHTHRNPSGTAMRPGEAPGQGVPVCHAGRSRHEGPSVAASIRRRPGSAVHAKPKARPAPAPCSSQRGKPPKASSPPVIFSTACQGWLDPMNACPSTEASSQSDGGSSLPVSTGCALSPADGSPAGAVTPRERAKGPRTAPRANQPAWLQACPRSGVRRSRRSVRWL